ncbi:uncharacterized protein [Bemisia tabaci]|uniref:uncharacterized protein n=1 Tax=Bemisia tabaci TaxID=7038 RepID=UPI003B28BAA6
MISMCTQLATSCTRMGEFKNLFWFIMISVGVNETNQKLLGSSDRSWASDVFPMESESWQALNWTRLASLNFTRLVKATKKVAESHSVEVIFAQDVEHAENNSEFVGSLFKKIGPIILTVRNATTSQEPRAKLAIVIVDEELDVWDLVNPNGTDDLWTSTKYYVLVTAAVPPNVLELFRTLWDVYFVSNVLLYATDGKEVPYNFPCRKHIIRFLPAKVGLLWCSGCRASSMIGGLGFDSRPGDPSLMVLNDGCRDGGGRDLSARILE